MANTINQVLGSNAIRGADRLRGGMASIELQTANAGVDHSYDERIQGLKSFANGLDNLGQVFENWTQANQKKEAQTGEERANYLLNHYTPTELADARRNGVMLYQDDPYAMKSLHQKIGQTVAQDVDNGMVQDVQNGRFKTRDELDQARAKRMNDSGKKFAESYGSDWDNVDFQRGLNSQVTERNIVLYGAHDKWLDANLKNAAALQHKSDNQALYSNPTFMRDKNSVGVVFQNLEKQRNEGGWDENTSQDTLRSDMSDIAMREGGIQFLTNAENQTVNYNGKQVAVKAFFSEQEWQGLRLKALDADFKLNAAKDEEFSNKLAGVRYDSDPVRAAAQLDQIKSQYNAEHPGDEMTPQRQMIIDTEQQMIAAQAQANETAQKALDKQTAQKGNIAILDRNWQTVINGGSVPTDGKDILGVDGKNIPQDDMVAFAQMKIQQINGLNIPEDQKNAIKLQFLQHDKEGGVFRSYYADTINQANTEMQRMMMSGKDTGDHKAFDNLRALYKSNPEMVAMAFPQSMGLFSTMDEMDASGLDMQTVIDAHRANDALKDDFQGKRDLEDNWTKMRGASADSDEGDLSNMDTRTAAAAKEVFMAQRYLGKDYDSAFKSAQAFVKRNRVQFTGSDTEGTSYGSLPKTSLMTSDNPESFTRGQQIVTDVVKDIETKHPEVVGHLAVEADGNGDILVRSPIEGFTYRLTNQALRQKDQETQQAHHQAAVEAAKSDLSQPHWKDNDIYAHLGEGDDIPAKVLRIPGEAWEAAKDGTNQIVGGVAKAAQKVMESPTKRSKRHEAERKAKGK